MPSVQRTGKRGGNSSTRGADSNDSGSVAWRTARLMCWTLLLCHCAVVSAENSSRNSPRHSGVGGTSACSRTGVRNDLHGAAMKAYHAPIVFTGTVRSRGAVRAPGGAYEVTVDVGDVWKGELTPGTLRLRYALPSGNAGDAASPLRRRRPRLRPRGGRARGGRRGALCLAKARLQTGDMYIVFVRPSEAAAAGARNFTAVSAPEPWSKKNSKKVQRVICKRCVRKPRVARIPDVTVALRRRVRLQCRVQGIPLPRVSWLKDGAPVTRGSRIRIKTRRSQNKKKRKRKALRSTLIIRKASAADAGVYTCRAKNMAGGRSQKTRVTVVRQSRRPGRGRRPPVTPSSRPRLRPSRPSRPRPSRPSRPRRPTEPANRGRPIDVSPSFEPCGIESIGAYCLNDGVCKVERTLQEKVCICAQGFEGVRCGKKTIFTIQHHTGVGGHDTRIRSPWQRRNKKRRQRHR